MGRYFRPRSTADALAALADGRWRLLAGGTDHYPARAVHTPDDDILDITALPGLRAITVSGDAVWVGCGATWTDLIEAPLPAALHALVEAARQIGGVQVQNTGTVVGNVCNASPAADGIACLIALDAELVLARAAGRRTMPVADFVLGPRRTERRPDEMALGIRIPLDRATARAAFEKLGARRYLVISIVMVASVARLARDGRIARAAVCVGACGPRAVRLSMLERDLIGTLPGAAHVRPEHLAGIAPIDDIRATADYRRTAALELVRRSLARLAPPLARAA